LGISFLNGFKKARAASYVPSLSVALAVTALLFVVPLAAAAAVQLLIPGGTIVMAMAAGLVASLLVTRVGTALWARSPRTGERVFADATLWGWLRMERARNEISHFEDVLERRNAIPLEVHKNMLMRLSVALDRRDGHTYGHSRRVARHAAAIARQLGMNDEAVAHLRVAATMHDVGKLHTTDERHPVDGAKMVEFTGDADIIAAVRHHHERFDGGGYPDGLVGHQIPLTARIITVADAFDAMVSDRPYRAATSHRKARQAVADGAGTQFDPDVATAFAAYYRGGNLTAAWGAFSALPPRAAQIVSDLLRGSASALGSAAGTTAAAVAIAAGIVGVGVPAAAEQVTQHGSPTASVVDSPDSGSSADPERAADEQVNSDADEHGSKGKSETGQPGQPGSSGDAAATQPSSSADEQSPAGKAGDAVNRTVDKTTGDTGETVKKLGGTVKDTGETVKKIAGDNDLTNTVTNVTDTAGDTVEKTGEVVKRVGDDLGDTLGGLTGGNSKK
jgi:putative nucleotidyltransferase with HDIG domain